jgi:hypothetical protein
MQHTVEDLIRKINVMVDKAIQIRTERLRYDTRGGDPYDEDLCKHLLSQVQQLAAEIANDREGDEIKTEELKSKM